MAVVLKLLNKQRIDTSDAFENSAAYCYKVIDTRNLSVQHIGSSVLTMANLSYIESRYDVLHATTMPMRHKGLYHRETEAKFFQVLVVNKMKLWNLNQHFPYCCVLVLCSVT